MYGAGSSTHHQSQESHHRSTPSRSSQQDGSNNFLHTTGSTDTPMSDAADDPAGGYRNPHIQIAHSDDIASQATSSVSQVSSQPPPSPRFRPHSQQSAPISGGPNDASIDRSQYVPSSGPASSAPSPATSVRVSTGPAIASPRRIKVKSLSHIQSFATDETSPFSQTRLMSRRSRRDTNDVGPQYEISEMPVSDIIEMVAGLLTKITTTNDRQHEHLHRQIPPPEGAGHLSQQTTSVLAFHGKNVPSISILSYLSRIHKYCPTTYEVFLSLLVYFDRMTERVNAGPMQSLRQANQQSLERAAAASEGSRHSSISSSALASHTSPASAAQAATPPPSGSLGNSTHASISEAHPPSPPNNMDRSLDMDPYNLSHFFVVDSFNIHRLVIAGVTCASKFFSDVFYTNSRYAKVGGLPLVELNHLELQFLLLNDFRLAVPLEEMEAYGTMLVEFYAREVVAQSQASRSALPGGQLAAVST
ncbi:cyclin-domain-containing protein [Pseudovirgaria hyperparasitica]|uniref:Cyclin-domain-containing protein n=1 Tax=Pseudovirgaria hyperparasitica TaxID=470096 RepID=A0A6A6W9L3_9PEZI|nr:cyclin-domain-containing protein [Pseudovirgaria hyperparasitica]KAF2759363.1 cyclin-domain-containing protein [Pseudovirgaria hyperparasitica]